MHAASAIRVVCEGPNAGAEISINGQFKGECPIDIQVQPGSIQLSAVKKSDPRVIGVFQRDLRIGDGVAQRIEVQLNLQQTPFGIRQEDEAIRANQLAYEKAMEARTERVQACASTRHGQAVTRAQDCYRNSGGCVGGLFCESYADRFRRCYGDPNGVVAPEPFLAACEREIAKPPSPPPLSPAAQRRVAERAEVEKREAAYRQAELQAEKKRQEAVRRSKLEVELVETLTRAQSGDAAAMYSLSLLLEARGRAEDKPAIVGWLKKAYEAKYPPAYGKLGSAFYNGVGVASDKEESLRIWREGAQLGDGRSMNGLGVHFLHGIGVDQDTAQAYAWMEQSAQRNDIFGTVNLAHGLRYATLGTEDLPRAFQLYQRVAAMEDQDRVQQAAAMDQLGTMYQDGVATKTDPVKAVHWYQRAADLGSHPAMLRLAIAHYNNYGGLKRNPEREKELLQRASAAGNLLAEQRLAQLYR